MKKILELMPDLEISEVSMLESYLEGWDDEKIKQFASIYRARRKDPVMIMLLTLAGFVLIAGLHRFVIGHIGMGVLYILTGGLCWIGTIVDLVNYKNLALEANQQAAREIAMMLKD